MATRGINIPMDIGASIVPYTGKTGNNTSYEDSPSSPSPARISKMRNVLPTKLGYQSAFAPAFPENKDGYPAWGKFVYSEPVAGLDPSPELINRNLLKGLNIQHVVAYETGSLDLIYVILTESGVWLHWPGYAEASWEMKYQGEEPLMEFQPIYLIDPQQGEFHLWTYCTLDNRLYLYRQGMEEVIIIGDLTLSADLNNWKNPHEVILTNEAHFIEVVTSTPSFLNMEGQIGVFKAGNRLGFWDSDNAIAWSSAFDKLDFTPDVVSLAGVTKFADVQGDIVLVLPTTEGFILYCTGAIIRVDPLPNSEERWTATTLLKGHGIAFYTHATVGTDPEYHVAWTNTGLFEIKGKTFQPLLMEEYRWLNEESPDSGLVPAIQIKLIGTEYLTVSKASFWEGYPAKTFVRQGMFKGEDGDYSFYLPAPPNMPDWKPGIFDVILGRLPDFPNVFTPEDDWAMANVPNPKDYPVLIPAWKGNRYKPQRRDLTFTRRHAESAVPLPELRSTAYPDVWFERKDYFRMMPDCLWQPDESFHELYVYEVVSAPSEWDVRDPGIVDNRFWTAYGQNFADLIQETLEDYLDDLAWLWGSDSFENRIGEPTGMVNRYDNCPHLYSLEGIPWHNVLQSYVVHGLNVNQFQEEQFRTEVDPITGETIQVPNVPDFTKLPTMPAQTEEELLLGEWLSESQYEYLEVFIKPYEDNLEYSNLHRVHSPSVTGITKVPWDKTPLKIVFDGCTFRILAFMDRMATTALWCMELILKEVVRRVDDDADPLPDGYWGSYTTIELPGGYNARTVEAVISRLSETFPASFIGKTREEINALVNPPEDELLRSEYWVPIFEAEIEALGYVVKEDWVSEYFWPVIYRMFLTGECTPWETKFSTSVSPADLENWIDEWSDSWDTSPDILGVPPTTTWPEEDFGFPSSPEFSWPFDIDYAAKFRRGTYAPYYPIYELAYVWDRVLEKWGCMNHPHGLVFPVAAENSSFATPETEARLMPFGILPKFSVPELNLPWHQTEYLWNSRRWELATYSDDYLERHQLPTFLSSTGEAGQLWIDAIALSRDGYTKLVGLSGNSLVSGAIEVRSSMTGFNFPQAGEDLTWQDTLGHLYAYPQFGLALGNYPETPNYAEDYPMAQFRMPFVLTGKEFQIVIRGHFHIHKLICYGQYTGHIQFFGPYYTKDLE